MKKLKSRLAALAKSLGIQTALRDRAVRRMKARHAEQAKAERQKEAAEDKAEKLRHEGHIARADRKSKKAQRLHAKAQNAEAKAIVWKQRARRKTQLIHGIEADILKVRNEIEALGPKVELENSKVVGGEFDERWRLSNLTSVACCSSQRRRNAYSQAGSPDIWHPYGPGPAARRRDDCSTYNTSQALATGADDPNGLDFSGEGYTGTQAQAHGRWKEVSLDRMVKAGQGYVIYGSGAGHHVECYCPSETDKMRTVGHGSAPVDFGTVHLFGSGEVERYFIYDA